MNWSEWRSFPDPRKQDFLHAPFGPGVYELRHRSTGELILFGIGGCCASRMTSLLPKPLGKGTRNNANKRAYVLEHIQDIEYRTCPTSTQEEAAAIERGMKKSATDRYRFTT